jgi:streptogramin lyase
MIFRAAAAVMTAAPLAGCTGRSAPSQVRAPATANYFAGPRVINLQRGEFPSFLAFGDHDNLWFTENDGDVIARIDQTGGMTQYSIQAGTNNNPQDIISVPGDGIWFTGLAEIGKIGPDGVLKVWHETTIGSAVGLPDALGASSGYEELASSCSGSGLPLISAARSRAC